MELKPVLIFILVFSNFERSCYGSEKEENSSTRTLFYIVVNVRNAYNALFLTSNVQINNNRMNRGLFK